ncbi:MAG: DUF3775 domain-containing protein [Magnetospirillum sp.]|nr:DUF3775 domain-containing protein [Magnetospirillum sp.]
MHRYEMMGDEERQPLATPLETLCFLIVKAREFDAKDAEGDEDSGSNPSDDYEISVLEESAEDNVAEELSSALDGLNDDERVEVLALVWLGRGDYEAGDWAVALKDAREVHNQRETGYLMGIPQLGDFLEGGLNALGYSCEDFEIGRL